MLSWAPASAIPDGAAAEALAACERILLARRERAADVAGALEEALVAALGAPPTALPAVAAARALARAVDRHGQAFAPGAEPAYHDRHHQAEATLAMGWLCGLARRDGMLDAEQALIGVAGMVAHDLAHPGDRGDPPGTLEAESARQAVAIAGEAGAPPSWCAALADLIRATADPAPAETSDLPLLHRLAREADRFGSTLPHLGLTLSRALARERVAGGDAAGAAVGTHRGRLAFLQGLPEPSAPGRALGLALARAAQLAAYGKVGRALGGSGSPEDGAAALDLLDMDEADRLYLAALDEVWPAS